MTKGRWGVPAIVLTSLLASAGARAQGQVSPFGAGHQLVLSAERLFGYTHATETLTQNGVDQTTTVDSFAVLTSPLGLFTFYSAPRLALDYFAAERFSVGLAAGYFRTSEEIPGAPNGLTLTFSGFILAPRAGFGAQLTPLVALWPRLGLTILRISLGAPGDDTNTTIYALTVEVPIVITIAPHLFLAGGPTLDLGLGGSNEPSAMGMSTSIDEKATSFGVQFSLGGYF